LAVGDEPTSILSNENHAGKTVCFCNTKCSDDFTAVKSHKTMDGQFAKDVPTFHYFQTSGKNSSAKK
jgi:hypothetical protein